MTKTNARNFVMARLGAARAMLSIATDAIDEVLVVFVAPDDDPKAKQRADGLEAADDAIGEAARAVQAAQTLMEEIDPKEGEPDLPEGDGHDEDEEEDE
jgi:hypothetical protein